jgi:hypothetical protein
LLQLGAHALSSSREILATLQVQGLQARWALRVLRLLLATAACMSP